jgi:hypothetical protein
MRDVRSIRDVLLLAALGACGSETTGGTPPPRDASPDVTPDVAPADVEPKVDVAPPPDVPPEASGIGDPCESEEQFGQGTCRAGQICLGDRIGFNGGYCVGICSGGARCPGDATCTQLQGFPVCLRRCTVTSDCRTADGYVCAVGSTAGQRVCSVNDAPVGARPDGAACFTTAAGPHMIAALPRRVFLGANSAVSAGRQDAVLAAEGNIAVHPTNGNVASSYIGLGGRGTSIMGVSSSTNGGTSWEWGSVSDPLGSASDPVLDFALSNGALRMTYIGLRRSNVGQVQGSSVRITESTDNGRTWATPRAVEPANACNQGGICDKPWIISGPGVTAGTESIYIGYLLQTSMAANLTVQRSDDGGTTWSTPATIGRYAAGTPTAPNLVQFAVGRPGEIAAAWVALPVGMAAGADGAVRFGSTDNRIFFRRSADGFRTQETLRVVSRPSDSPVYVQPPVAIDGDRIHVLFPSGNATAAWDLILATSTDAGNSWQYRKVNDEPDACATHAFPAMVVDTTTHAVHAIWLENRFGDGAVAYARCPADPAMPCGANEAVSDERFTFTTGRDPMSWHGDYLGLTLSPQGELWATWSDTRTGRPQMYVAHGRAR